MSLVQADVNSQEREKVNLAQRNSELEGEPMTLPISHLRALYTEIVLRRGGPASAEAKEFRDRLRDNSEFKRQAQIVGELYRKNLLIQKTTASAALAAGPRRRRHLCRS
jgi:hypothetical protein